MKIAAQLREAGLNAISGTSKIARYFTALTLIGISLLAIDITAITQSLKNAYDYRDSGANIFIYTSDQSIDPVVCESLAAVPGVKAAGAIRKPQEMMRLVALPGNPIPQFEATPGISEILLDERIPSGVLLSPQAAEPLDSNPGDIVSTVEGPMTVSAVFPYPADGRRNDFEYSALKITAPTGMFNECWAQVWPVPHPVTNYLGFANSVSGRDSSGGVVTQLNGTKGTAADFLTEFENRPTRFVPYGVGFAALIIAFTAIWARKLENAAMLHAGMRKNALRLIALTEVLMWALPAAITMNIATLYFSKQIEATDRLALWNLSIFTGLCALTGAIIGSLVATALTKEQQLFNYFKAR